MFSCVKGFLWKIFAIFIVLVWVQILVDIHRETHIYAQSGGESDRLNEPANESLQALYNRLKSGHRVQPEGIKQQPHIAAEQPTVYLTFDDGPSKNTPMVLDILQARGVKAAFFVLGNMAEDHPEWIKRIVHEGHTLGNHTYDHVYRKLYGDFGEYWRQIQKTQNILNGIVGLKPELVRAPGGTYANFDAFYYYYLDQAGYTVMDWNMDSQDSTRANISAEEIIQAVKRSELKHEVILLMHDGAGHHQTVQALPEIIDYFQSKGYAFAPLTVNVSPVQFPIAKNGWDRFYSFAKFAEQESQVAAYVEERSKALAAEKQKTEALRLLALRPKTPLTVNFNSSRLILQPMDYDFTQGKFMVPLRSIIKALGGYLNWNESGRIATAYYGLRKIEYNLADHTIREYAANGQSTSYSLQPFMIRNGTLVVPVRSVMQMLGNYISSFNVAETQRQVSIYQGFTTQMITDWSGIASRPIAENSLLQG
jgi:peptidoglycan/xylan/chitin deacetylase (PgdA/CDA1 family)